MAARHLPPAICHQSHLAGDTPLVGRLTCIHTTQQIDDVELDMGHSMRQGRQAFGGVGERLGTTRCVRSSGQAEETGTPQILNKKYHLL